MLPQTRKSPVLFVAALLVLIALTSTACSFSGVEVSTISPLIDITLHQEDFDQLSLKGDINACGLCDKLLDEISRVEMHDGFIRYLGTKVQPDRSKVDGSFDMSLGAEKDMLKAKIVAVNIPGIDLDDPRVVEANQELEEDLAHLLTHSYGDVLFKEMVVKEGLLRMKIQVNINFSADPSIRIRID
jgi:hypothetical protein